MLGLAPADGMQIEFRSDLNDKIIEVVAKKALTHSDVARLAHTSRTRVTAILNRNTHDISTDLTVVLFVVIATREVGTRNKRYS